MTFRSWGTRADKWLDKDMQRHCAAGRAGEHAPRGAMPPRAGQLRRQASTNDVTAL